MSSSLFFWKTLVIEHDDHVLKIGTDAILLGSWIPKIIQHAETILDAGTGTGILALIMSQHFPAAKIIAIDVDHHAVQLAQKNFTRNNMQSNAFARIENISNHPDNCLFDLVISNPPFYFNQSKPESKIKLHAKHSDLLPGYWMKNLIARLTDNGNICIVIPYTHAAEWITAANAYKLYCTSRLNIYSFEKDKTPIRSLLHFSRQLIKPQTDSIVMYEGINEYSPDYVKLTGIE